MMELSQMTVTKTSARTVGVLAEFADVGSLLTAAAKMRDKGYKNFDCHSPFAIHGMDSAMGAKRSPLGWIVGIAAIIGGSGALLMQWWMSAVDYPIIISGKAFNSFQAWVPITFELTILLSAFGAVFGMLALSGLPRLYHAVFSSDRFAKATDDGFFISVEEDGDGFNVEEVTRFLESIGGKNVETLTEA